MIERPMQKENGRKQALSPVFLKEILRRSGPADGPLLLRVTDARIRDG